MCIHIIHTHTHAHVHRRRVPGLVACFAGDAGRTRLRKAMPLLGGAGYGLPDMMELEDLLLAHGSGDYY